MTRKTLTALEVFLPKCIHTYGVAPCAAVQGFLGPNDEIAADFDGSNDYLTRGAGLTGAADSKSGTFSVWFTLDSLAAQVLFFGATTLAGATSRIKLEIVGTGQFRIVGRNAAGTDILSIVTAASTLSTGVIYHIVGSFDLSSTSRRHLYVNGQSNATVVTYTDDTIDFTLADYAVGAQADGNFKTDGRIGDFWFSPGTYMNLSVERNLRKFITEGGNPVALGSTGQLPTGTSPLIFLSSPDPATNFQMNKGTGGNFTENGSLSNFAATGCLKCFNSPPTCQDLDNFNEGGFGHESVTHTRFTTGATAHLVAMPATVAAGDLLLVIFVNDGSATVATPASWTSLGSQASGTAVRLSVFAKDAAGTEGGTTVDFVTSASEIAMAQVYRYLAAQWGGTLATDVDIVLADEGATDVPSPNIITAGWGEMEGNSCIAAIGSSEPRVCSRDGIPAMFKDPHWTRGSVGDATDVGIVSCSKIASDETVDPGTFVLNASSAGVVSASIIVKPGIFTDSVARFVSQAEYTPKSLDALACIEGDDFSPAVVSLGESIGERSSLKIEFGDPKHSDTGSGYDPYLSSRIYNPYELGSHWGKWRARWFTLQGSKCQFYRFFDNQDLTNGERRRLYIETSSGPNVDGSFSITAKDVLKFLDGTRALAPALSEGRLSVGINAGAVTFTLVPSGVGETYPTSGYFTIGGDEIVYANREGGDLFVGVLRGQLGTTAKAHNADDRVQECLRYVSRDPAEVIADLEINYGEVDPELITLSEWQTETSAFLNVALTATIAEPTPVKQLVSEILEQTGMAHWFDDLGDGALRLQVLRNIGAATVIDEDVFERKTLSVQEQPEKRVSRCIVFFGQNNPLEPLDDEKNYRSALIEVAVDDELRNGRIPATKKIFSRWIADGGFTVAERLAQVVTERFGNGPRRFTFEVPRKNIEPALGGAYVLRAHSLQEATGDPASVPVQVTRLRPEPDRFVVTAEEQNSGVLSGLTEDIVTIQGDTNNINLQNLHDSIYPAAVSGDTIKLIIQSGVVLGSTSTSIPALTIGTFASGVTVDIENNGTVAGSGGAGGEGGNDNQAGDNGADGGIGLYTRQAINLTNNGTIGGGGGGAGGGGGGGSQGGGGGGGGGGAGRNSSSGGGGGNKGTAAGARNGNAGSNGSLLTGGNKGNGGDGGTGSGGDGGNGGDGGDLGDNGSDGIDGSSGGAKGLGGSAGAAIDGNSFVTYTVAGTIEGATIN